MIPTELAAQALAIVTPLLIKGGETLMQGVGKDLWEGIKSIFKKQDKQGVIEKFEKDPGDVENKQEVAAHLTSIMYSDASVKEQVEKLITSFTNNQQGNNVQATGNVKSVVSGDSISGSTINIS